MTPSPAERVRQAARALNAAIAEAAADGVQVRVVVHEMFQCSGTPTRPILEVTLWREA